MQTIEQTHKDTRQALSDRIKQAKTINELERVAIQITKHYNAGTIDISGFKRLDSMILDRLVKIECAE